MPELTAAPVNTVTLSERESIKSFDSTTVTISKVLKTHSTVSYGQYGQAMVKAAMIALAEKNNSSAQGDKTVILPKNRRKTPRKPYDGGAAAAVKKYIAARGHPPVADMVVAAITALKEREGSSIQAIKKYIAANYNVDAEKISSSIKKYLKTAVFVGSLIQNSEKGTSGYFKLNKPSSSSKDA